MYFRRAVGKFHKETEELSCTHSINQRNETLQEAKREQISRHMGLVEARLIVRCGNSNRKRQCCPSFWQRKGTEWTETPFCSIGRIQSHCRTIWVVSKRKCLGLRIELACFVSGWLQSRANSLRKLQPECPSTQSKH